jgi:hypothetical protein
MECIAPPPPDDVQLLAYLDGQAPADLQGHLELCAFCRERLNDLARFQGVVTAGLFRLRCPSPVKLGEYHLGLLPDDTREAIERHLAECPHCTAEMAQLQGYLHRLAPDLEPRREAQPRPQPAQPGSSLLDELVARLLPRTLAPALRGEAQGPLVAEAEGITLVLDLQPADEGRLTIVGQLAAEDQDRWVGARAELRRANDLEQSTTVDDLGAFRFELVLPGLIDLHVAPQTGPGVVVPDVDAKA